jgi:hypothetical protein
MDDLLSPFGSVIGFAPSLPSARALYEAGDRLPYSSSPTLPFAFPAGRAVQKWGYPSAATGGGSPCMRGGGGGNGPGTAF